MFRKLQNGILESLSDSRFWIRVVAYNEIDDFNGFGGSENLFKIEKDERSETLNTKKWKTNRTQYVANFLARVLSCSPPLKLEIWITSPIEFVVLSNRSKLETRKHSPLNNGLVSNAQENCGLKNRFFWITLAFDSKKHWFQKIP